MIFEVYNGLKVKCECLFDGYVGWRGACWLAGRFFWQGVSGRAKQAVALSMRKRRGLKAGRQRQRPSRQRPCRRRQGERSADEEEVLGWAWLGGEGGQGGSSVKNGSYAKCIFFACQDGDLKLRISTNQSPDVRLSCILYCIFWHISDF